ncbi:hypothetical protein TWF970_002355 [Orbilia oligospora]|uniref:Uncharacterized protein n=1 Tax=Orbilia oligospora TaxID=2813651 RepID=A0A7C8V8S6_ORBOL|nr:hypothetical protein TWF970_002355 [Orbilia oligospora]
MAIFNLEGMGSRSRQDKTRQGKRGEREGNKGRGPRFGENDAKGKRCIIPTMSFMSERFSMLHSVHSSDPCRYGAAGGDNAPKTTYPKVQESQLLLSLALLFEEFLRIRETR